MYGTFHIYKGFDAYIMGREKREEEALEVSMWEAEDSGKGSGNQGLWASYR